MRAVVFLLLVALCFLGLVAADLRPRGAGGDPGKPTELPSQASGVAKGLTAKSTKTSKTKEVEETKAPVTKVSRSTKTEAAEGKKAAVTKSTKTTKTKEAEETKATVVKNIKTSKTTKTHRTEEGDEKKHTRTRTRTNRTEKGRGKPTALPSQANGSAKGLQTKTVTKKA